MNLENTKQTLPRVAPLEVAEALSPGITKLELPSPQAGVRANSHTALSAAEVHAMVETAAYFRSQKRAFVAGHELQDWLAAEAEVRRQLGCSVGA